MRARTQPRHKPAVGDVMRDGTGRRFEVLSVGLRYANVRPLYNTDITSSLVKLSDLFPVVILAEPVSTFDGEGWEPVSEPVIRSTDRRRRK
jgi:hypothetical protein